MLRAMSEDWGLSWLHPDFWKLWEPAERCDRCKYVVKCFDGNDFLYFWCEKSRATFHNPNNICKHFNTNPMPKCVLCQYYGVKRFIKYSAALGDGEKEINYCYREMRPAINPNSEKRCGHFKPDEQYERKRSYYANV